MRRKTTLFATGAAVAIAAATFVAGPASATATCFPTDVSRDGKVLTAAQIGGDVAGALDATGCNIGVYYGPGTTGNVTTGADISGANYFGVLVNSVPANVTGAAVHNIGENPLNGSQHGNAIVYINGATGTVSGTTVSHYQKNGITVSGKDADETVATIHPTSVALTDNTVTGEGPVSYIAQNGIQVSYGASATLRDNTVSGNWYTPAGTEACGLLYFQSNGVKAQSNSVFANEKNVCNVGRGGGSNSP